MGRHGPAPEPPAAKRARGITAPSRVNYEAPMPRQRPPKMPRGMPRNAQLVWSHVVREMPPGVILAVDGAALRIYCEAVARYDDVVATYIATGGQPLIRGRTSNELVKNPLLQVIRDNGEQARLWARELGLTPAARAGLRMEFGAQAPGIASELGPPPRLRVVNLD